MNEKYSDNELIRLYKEGDAAAFEEIATRYKKVVKASARKYFLFGGDEEDVLQEGMLGLFSAVNSYSEDKNASFSTFARICIENGIKTAITKANKFREADDLLGEPETAGDPEIKFINGENLREISETIREGLTDKENRILSDYLAGLNYAEIAEKNGVSKKSVDNAVQRIKRKIKGNEKWHILRYTENSDRKASKN